MLIWARAPSMRERNDIRVRSKNDTPSLTSSLSIVTRSGSSTCGEAPGRGTSPVRVSPVVERRAPA